MTWLLLSKFEFQVATTLNGQWTLGCQVYPYVINANSTHCCVNTLSLLVLKNFLGAEPPVNEPPSHMEGAMMVASPMIKVEIDYIALGLESKLILNTPRQSLMESCIDSWKKSLVDHVLFDHGFLTIEASFPA